LLSLAAVALALAVPLAQAGDGWPTLSPRPHITAARAPSKVVIDGRLDEAAWIVANPSDTFTQHFPNEGAAPSERTVVLVLYDDRNLYVGVDCEQIHSPIVRRLQRRDGPLPSDGVWIDIDSRRTGVGAFHFSINAAGALADGIHYDDIAYSGDFDAVWEAKVADTPRGYSIEFRIPLSVLRFSALPVQDWGFQVRRFIDARQETLDWAYFPRSATSYVPLFGRIDDLVGLAPRHTVELRPFVLGRVGHRAAGADATLQQGWDAAGSAGLDAKAHVTNELALDMAVNPDFGQVEADTRILNLSTFETFFPEKRPFFLEGIDVFSSIRPLVYTRRIGRLPPAPTLAANEVMVRNIEPSRIWGAAKLVGTLGGRTTVGMLSALTGENVVEVQDASGIRTQRVLDPWTTHNALRLKRVVGGNADVGLLATASNRFGGTTSDAYVASTDGRWRSPSGHYGVAWQAIGSTLRGGTERLQPDGIPIRPGVISGGGSLYAAKDGGRHWLVSAWQHVAGRQLEINDMGYLERKNDYQGEFKLTYRTLDPWWRTLQTNTWLALRVRESLDGIRLGSELKLASSWDLRAFWNLYLDVHVRGTYYDDREMGDGSALERPGAVGAIADMTSDPRRRVTGNLNVGFDRREGGYRIDGTGRLTLRVLPQLELDLIPTASYDTGAPRYITSDPVMGMTAAMPGTELQFFGVQTAATIGTTLRAAYTFTPELSLQLYTQLFLARVRYGALLTFAHTDGVRERVPLSALMPATMTMPMTPVDPNRDEATLNVNLVLRWEYRLGSTLFLVYTRAQNPALMPAADGSGFQVRPLWQGRASADFIMLKLSYWWG
jgi:hypothetical protein